MTADLVPVDNMAALDGMDAETRELAVTQMLSEARSWLAHAVEATSPQAIANFKAQMATVAVATRQLGLSREIQLDAQEMVRRAERGMGLAVKRGQQAGEIKTLGDGGGDHVPGVRGSISRQSDNDRGDPKPSPNDYFTNAEQKVDSYAFAAVPDDDFDEAVVNAKAEGNLSRANVVRKVKGKSSAMTRLQRVDMIRDLAVQGFSSRQMEDKVGVQPVHIRKLAREFAIDIPADRVIGRSPHLDHNYVMAQTVETLAGLRYGIDLIDLEALDRGQIDHWATSLAQSIRMLNRFHKRVKEMAQ